DSRRRRSASRILWISLVILSATSYRTLIPAPTPLVNPRLLAPRPFASGGPSPGRPPLSPARRRLRGLRPLRTCLHGGRPRSRILARAFLTFLRHQKPTLPDCHGR